MAASGTAMKTVVSRALRRRVRTSGSKSSPRTSIGIVETSRPFSRTGGEWLWSGSVRSGNPALRYPQLWRSLRGLMARANALRSGLKGTKENDGVLPIRPEPRSYPTGMRKPDVGDHLVQIRHWPVPARGICGTGRQDRTTGSKALGAHRSTTHLRCKTATAMLAASNPSTRSRLAATDDGRCLLVASGILTIAARMIACKRSGCMVTHRFD